jgi:hypothetical protein
MTTCFINVIWTIICWNKYYICDRSIIETNGAPYNTNWQTELCEFSLLHIFTIAKWINGYNRGRQGCSQNVPTWSLMFADATFCCVLRIKYICVSSFPVHVSHEIYSDVVRYVVVYLPNLSCTETYLRNLYFELCIEYFVCGFQLLFVH